MVTEILVLHKLVSFEKIDTTIYATAEEACNATAEEIAALIKQKAAQRTNNYVGFGNRLYTQKSI